MDDALSHASLKARQRACRDTLPQDFDIRVHRALSWFGRADVELEKTPPDPDAAFVFLWIAFNAAYGGEREMDPSPEHKSIMAYFRKLENHDVQRRLYDAIWSRFAQSIRVLLDNKYVFQPFWDHYNGMASVGDWETCFAEDKKRVSRALAARDTCKILEKVFNRLYVLRNQLIHGGATWNSTVNRDQVRDGQSILRFLVPVFLDIMMDAPFEQWGKMRYPVDLPDGELP